jgi:hypothetical protein
MSLDQHIKDHRRYTAQNSNWIMDPFLTFIGRIVFCPVTMVEVNNVSDPYNATEKPVSDKDLSPRQAGSSSSRPLIGTLRGRIENVAPPIRVASMILIAVLFGGCGKDGPSKWDVDVLAPLVSTRFTIGDLLADSLVTTDTEGRITLVYASELFAVDLDSLLGAPDTNFVYRYGLPTPGPLAFPAGLEILDIEDASRFEIDGVELRTIALREGVLRIRTTNMVASTLLGSFQLTGATFPDGQSTILTSVGPGTPASPATNVTVRDLAGSRFDLRGPQFNSVNTLYSLISSRLDPNGQGAVVTDQDSILIDVSYSGLVPAYAKGFFGQRAVQQEGQDLPLDLFRNVVAGSLDLDQVTLKLNVENGVGIDIQVAINSFQAFNSRTGTAVDLSHAILNGPINLNRAIDLGTGPQPSYYANVLDNSDSNIDEFLEVLPDRVTYDVSLLLNPLGDISNGNDFLYYESRLKADLELEVPLNIIASDLTLETIVEPDLPGSAEGHALQSGELMVFGTNGFPFATRLELAIVNEAGDVLGQLPVSGELLPGVLGPDRTVIQAVDSRTSARITPEQLDLLYQGNKLRLRAAFNTVDPDEHLRILDRYALDVQITARANYLVNGDE